MKPAAGAYDLFDLYDGSLKAVPGFSDEGALHDEDGLRLGFETLSSAAGAFDLLGSIHVPWTPADGFDDVTYDQVKLDVGELIATLAKPFDVVDPYLGPARDVIDVLRTPMPVVSDLSELGGGDEISLLSLLDTLSGADKRLELAYRVISFIDSATQIDRRHRAVRQAAGAPRGPRRVRRAAHPRPVRGRALLVVHADGPDQHHGHAPGRSVDAPPRPGRSPRAPSRTPRSRPSPASATRRPPRSARAPGG